MGPVALHAGVEAHAPAAGLGGPSLQRRQQLRAVAAAADLGVDDEVVDVQEAEAATNRSMAVSP